jgi:D-hexose-6-phosphate mutarotase
MDLPTAPLDELNGQNEQSGQNGLHDLNDRYAIPFKLRFKALGDGLIAADISNPHATASICLQGGQVLSWQPTSTVEPVIWLSSAAKFSPQTSIRGGIPVCWPWFSAHSSEVSFPMHGFARTQPWQVKGSRSLDNGSTEIRLTMPITTAMQAMWSHQAQLDMLINVGETLKIALITRNLGVSDFTITEALHTYFSVSDVAQVQVEGLDGIHFHDKAAGWTEGDQAGAIGFAAEVDRVYVNTPQRCTIVDPAWQRHIHIAKLGSQSTVVWNPWAARAAQMGDLGNADHEVNQDGWKRFVCVESANARENAVTVPAGKSHTMAVEYRVEAI